MAVLEGFKKVSIALVGAFGLAGAVFFGFKVAGAFVAAELQARDYLKSCISATTTAIGTDFSIVSFAMLLACAD
jgi:hypothetical protein